MNPSLADKLLPKRLRDEIERVLNANNLKRANQTQGSVSKATQKERRQVIRLSFAQLWKLGYRLKSIRSFGERHVRVLMQHWEEKNLSAGTLHTRLSYLSTFASWIGKAGMVRPPVDYCSKERIARTRIARTNKAWEANGKLPEEVIAMAKEIDERLSLYLTLQHTLGLRVKESIEFRPLVSLSDDGKTVEIFGGTKGGRRRTVTIETEAQRAVIEWALKVAKATRGGRCRWPDLTFRQARRKFYSLMERQLHITKRDAGVTAHGLRHGFAQEHYHRRTGGLPTPIEGGAIGQIDRNTHAKAGLSVSKALGHSRLSITGAYYGSYGHALRNVEVAVQPMTLNLVPSVNYA